MTHILPIADLSKFNPDITDYTAFGRSVTGVILRCGYRGYSSGTIEADSKFEKFAAGLSQAGIPFGLYFFSQAVSIGEAKAEAEFSLALAEKYNARLPVFIDSEYSGASNNGGRADGLTREERTEIVLAFCKLIEDGGRKTGVYASTSWFKDKLNVNKLLNYLIWCAQYGNDLTAAHRVDLWQYTSTGSVGGIAGNVDLSACVSSCDVLFENEQGSGAFTDVSEDYYAYPYINELADLGIVRGISNGDGTFRYEPTEPLTRGDAAIMLVNLINYLKQ